MSTVVAMVIPVLIGCLVLRMLMLPIRLLAKLAIHGGCGFVCLWLLNSTAVFTGVSVPVNPATALTAGFLGIPGIGVMVLLEMMR